MSNFKNNTFFTTDLTLNVMQTCATSVGQDINDNAVADVLYDICCELEDFPEDQGFGSSDNYSYIKQAEAAFPKK
jgi:hypothetical protein